jgi:hypothetical protein
MQEGVVAKALVQFAETTNTSTFKLNLMEHPSDCIILLAHDYLFKGTSGITAV